MRRQTPEDHRRPGNYRAQPCQYLQEGGIRSDTQATPIIAEVYPMARIGDPSLH